MPKHIYYYVVFGLLLSFIHSVLSADYTITFTTSDQYIRTDKTKKQVLISAKFNPAQSGQKYLYFFNQIESAQNAKIFFAEDGVETPNYLNSLYSTQLAQTGLYVRLSEFKSTSEVTTKILIQCSENCDLVFHYRYMSKFQIKDSESEFKFLLPSANNANNPLSITLIPNENDNIYTELLSILSENSLKNFGIKVVLSGQDVTQYANVKPVFSNGYSISIDTIFGPKEVLLDKTTPMDIQISNNYGSDQLMTISLASEENLKFVYSGMSFAMTPFIEYDKRTPLLFNEVNDRSTTKNSIIFIDNYYINSQLASRDRTNITPRKKLEDYSTHAIYQKGSFSWFNFNPLNTKDNFTSFNFQFFYPGGADQYANQVLLKPLVSGYTKHFFLEGSNSLYHWLPINYVKTKYKKIHYYLRPKVNKPSISFGDCSEYPNNCSFNYTTVSAFPHARLIENIGLYYTQPVDTNKVQLIFASCGANCEYDISMTYDNEAQTLYPNKNIMKFMNDNLKDVFVLPVIPTLFNDVNIERIDIELISYNGKVDLFLYQDIKLTKEVGFNYTETGRKFTISVHKDSLIKNSYVEKDLYAVVTGTKNSYYNIKYEVVDINKKTLLSNQVNIETLKVGSEGEEKKQIFSFKNTETASKGPFYISISSLSCQSTVIMNGKSSTGYSHSLTVTSAESVYNSGEYQFEMYLINDGKSCLEGREDKVNIIGYPSIGNDYILINDYHFINTSYIKSNNAATYRYLFKPTNPQEDLEDYLFDHSININLKKYSNKGLTVTYSLENISPLTTTKPVEFSKKNIEDDDFYRIDSENITEICPGTDENDLCSLTITISSTEAANTRIDFSIYLSRNDYSYPRLLGDNEYLVNSVDSNKYKYIYQYHLIDLNKGFDNHIIIDSFGQTPNVYTKLITSKKILTGTDYNRVITLPTKENFANTSPKYDQFTKKIIVAKSSLESCTNACQLIIGILLPLDYVSQTDTQTFYSIHNSLIDSSKDAAQTIINLPANYYLKDTFSKINGERYYFVNLYHVYGDNIVEIEAMNQNEEDDTVIDCFVKLNGQMPKTNSYDMKFSSKEKRLLIPKAQITAANIYILIKSSSTSAKTDIKISYKVRVTNPLINGVSTPLFVMNSLGQERCTIARPNDYCYYFMRIRYSNPIKQINFYIPDNEYASIYIKSADGKAFDSSNGAQISVNLPTKEKNELGSDSPLKNTNYLKYILDRSFADRKDDKILLIGVTAGAVGSFKVLSTPYQTPVNNYLEGKMSGLYDITFNDAVKSAIFNINNENKNKMNIFIKAVKGDGAIYVGEKKYLLGLNTNGKDNLNIVSSDTKLEIKSELSEYDSNDEFTFAINYETSTDNKILNGVNFGKANTFSYLNANNLENIDYYFKANFTKNAQLTHNNDITINLKIYCNDCNYNVKALIITESALNSIKTGSGIEFISSYAINDVFTIIDGNDPNLGGVTFKTINVNYELFTKNIQDLSTAYIYLRLEKKNCGDSIIKVDVVPTDLTNNLPLVTDQMYIQKIYQNVKFMPLLLMKSDITNPQMRIEFVHPGSNYDIAIAHLTEKNSESLQVTSNETSTLTIHDKFEHGKHYLTLKFTEQKYRYLIFNIINKRQKELTPEEEEKNKDYFIFKYKSNYLIKDIFFMENSTITYTTSSSHIRLKFKPLKSGGFINHPIKYYANLYGVDDFKNGINNYLDLDLYLKLKKIEPIKTDVKLVKENLNEIDFKIEDLDNDNFYLTLTAIGIDNEKEDIMAYETVEISTVFGGSVGTYVKDHTAYFIIIVIICLLVLGMMCSICCAERKERRNSSNIEVNVNTAKELMP